MSAIHRPLFCFRSKTPDGELSKTYVHVTNADTKNPQLGIYIYRLVLTEKRCTGWKLLKKYKGKKLYTDSFHILADSLNTVIEGLARGKDNMEYFVKKHIE